MESSADTEDHGTWFNNLFVNKSSVDSGITEESVIPVGVELVSRTDGIKTQMSLQINRVTGNEGIKTLKLITKTETLTCLF